MDTGTYIFSDRGVAPLLHIDGVGSGCARRVLTAVADSGGITRGELSDKLSLSRMTVGKVIDALAARGIIVEEKRRSGVVGRRAGVSTISDGSLAAVISISPSKYKMSFVDLSMRVTDSVSYAASDEYTFFDNLLLFLKNARVDLGDRCAKGAFGIAITVPDGYDPITDRATSADLPEIDTVRLRELTEETLGQPVDLIMSEDASACLSFALDSGASGSETVAYVYTGDALKGIVCDRGHIISGAHGRACRFGRLRGKCGETLDFRIAHSRCGAEISVELAAAVYDIIVNFDPDSVVIISDLFSAPRLAVETINHTLASVYGVKPDASPRLSVCRPSAGYGVIGAALELRRLYFERII